MFTVDKIVVVAAYAIRKSCFDVFGVLVGLEVIIYVFYLVKKYNKYLCFASGRETISHLCKITRKIIVVFIQGFYFI